MSPALPSIAPRLRGDRGQSLAELAIVLRRAGDRRRRGGKDPGIPARRLRLVRGGRLEFSGLQDDRRAAKPPRRSSSSHRSMCYRCETSSARAARAQAGGSRAPSAGRDQPVPFPGGHHAQRRRAHAGPRSLGTLSNDYDSAVYSINTGEPLVMNVPSICEREMGELVGKITGVQPEPEKKSRWPSWLRHRQRRRVRVSLPASLFDSVSEEEARPEPSIPAVLLAGAER